MNEIVCDCFVALQLSDDESQACSDEQSEPEQDCYSDRHGGDA